MYKTATNKKQKAKGKGGIMNLFKFSFAPAALCSPGKIEQIFNIFSLLKPFSWHFSHGRKSLSVDMAISADGITGKR